MQGDENKSPQLEIIQISKMAKFCCEILYTFVLREEIATIFGPNVVGMW